MSGWRSRRRDQRGVSTVELVLYMPLLMIAILFAVQFSLVYLGSQVASGAAREAARVARVTGNAGQGQAVGEQIVANIGSGRARERRGAGAAGRRTGDAGGGHRGGAAVLPFLDPPRVSETVQGPVERFVPDS